MRKSYIYLVASTFLLLLNLVILTEIKALDQEKDSQYLTEANNRETQSDKPAFDGDNLESLKEKRKFDQEDEVYDKNSWESIKKSDIVYRQRFWTRVDLLEKKNKPFFTPDKEFTKFIIEGVKEGKLTPYTNDTLNVEMNQEAFLENLALPKEVITSSQEDNENDWGNDSNENKENTEAWNNCFLPNEVSILEIREDYIFHRTKSRALFNMLSIGIIIPGNKYPTGLEKAVAYFKAKDIINYFNEIKEQAIWFNTKNTAENLTIAQALILRLFDYRIIKIENQDDRSIEDIYGEETLATSEKLRQELARQTSEPFEY